MSSTRRLSVVLIAVIAALGLVQLVPYGRDRTLPPDGAAPAWDSPRTEQLARRACFDCHSHETRWPWYASVAPVSWRIASHVAEGRAALDFSAFDPTDEHVAEAAGEAGEAVAEGEMPTRDYLWLHPEARLSPAERKELIAGLDRTFAAYLDGEHGERSAKPGGRDRESRAAHVR